MIARAKALLKFAVKGAIAPIIVAAFVLGYLAGSGGSSPEDKPVGRVESVAPAEASAEFWTCSMHPQVHMPSPGKCPLCGMDLVLAESGSAQDREGDHAPEIRLSAAARKLAEIETAVVERRFADAEIRLTGKVEFDETRIGYITARFPGRLERLYVDYTGISVQQGDHLADLYSPDFLSAQQELLQAIKAAKQIEKSGLASMRETTSKTVDAVREKLRLWGLGASQIRDIERRGKPADHITIFAPMSGIVVHKDAVEGMYVQTGAPIYTIADLSHVWMKLDAYESDLPWIRYGQEVEFETEAYPGESFHGTIAFIDPVLDAKTRTIKVRVNVPNEDGRLKPEMFTRAIVHSKISAGGKIMDASLAGKWICPMHPEIVKDQPGPCDICGMDLVRASSLGFVNAEEAAGEAPLVIPATAPLITGRRAVVYVENPDEAGVYTGREIRLGPRAGDYYLVESGLAEGERVVVRGNFKIDSAIQISAQTSMMNPPDEDHDHATSQPASQPADQSANQ